MLPGMTAARHLTAPPGLPGHFHCTARVVQQMYLCGMDKRTGQNFDHRRDWIAARIEELAEIFAVAVHSYAVMSNHLHLVITVDPEQAASWSALEVAQRATALYRREGEDEQQRLNRANNLKDNPKRIAVLRSRLGSLSHFMAALNYPIARRANAESGKKGHFWDKRFHCQRLEDEGAILSAMTYVDLNPIRAGIAEDLPGSNHTSAQKRIQRIEADRRQARAKLKPIFGCNQRALLPIDQSQYLELVDITGRLLHPGKRGRIEARVPTILRQLGLSEVQWQNQVRGTESRYCRAIGSLDSLLRLTETLGQNWIRGTSFARAIARNS